MSPAIRKWSIIAGILATVVTGAALLCPLSEQVYEEQKNIGLQPEPPHIDRTDALSQQIAFLSLGGMRSLVAEILTLEATNAWLKQDWEGLYRHWDAAVTLSPQRTNYWLNAAYDMTNNAAGYLASDTARPYAERMAEARRYIKRGEQFLLRGIAQNPRNWRLHLGLAEQYSNLYRRPQFSKAAKALELALKYGAPSYYKRFRFYHLCRTRGAEQEAWKLGRELFNNPDNRQTSLLNLLFVLQHKIEVPTEEALSVTELFRTAPAETEEEIMERAIEELSYMLDNDLLYPVNGIEEFLKTHEEQ